MGVFEMVRHFREDGSAEIARAVRAATSKGRRFRSWAEEILLSFFLLCCSAISRGIGLGRQSFITFRPAVRICLNYRGWRKLPGAEDRRLRWR